jgi:hypothetical protein
MKQLRPGRYEKVKGEEEEEGRLEVKEKREGSQEGSD